MQAFKGDELEGKFYASFAGPNKNIASDQLDAFFLNAYTNGALGDLLFTTMRTPLSNAIRQDIFRTAFNEIFTDAFVRVGTFSAYIAVFKKIFGEDVSVNFTVPGPGKLNIAIVAAGVELSNWVARRIENNAFVNDEVIDDAGDNIAFQTIKGFESEYELQVMLFEMVPAGIFTTISLTLGV